MLVSKYLIGKFLPKIHEITDQQLIDACSAIGIEVENVHHHPKTNNLVIGEIIKVEPHPNAAKLHVCEVKVNQTNKTHTIICGAPNVAIKHKVIVALNGAKLHDGRIIEYKELRGILSQGMICAYGELTPFNQYQSDEDSSGIILLSDGIVGDQAIEKYVGLNDTIYDLSIPSNRNDLNGVLPLCQELSGFFKWNYALPSINELKGNFKEEMQLSYDERICNGMAIIKIKDISQNNSNWLMKSILMNNGVKPINTTLDQLAYLTLLTNIPTAVYDADKLQPSFSVVRANNNDEIVVFGNKTLKLTNNDIVVKTQDKIISLAGVIGANEYGLSSSTKNIYVEVANFNFMNIRSSAIRLDLQTDAAKRFSKATAIFLNKLMLTLIYEQFNGYQISYPNGQFKEQPVVKIDVDYNFINKFIGVNLTGDVIQQSLKYYGFEFVHNTCIVPPYRLDLHSSQDMSEEILKFININDLPIVPITSSTEINNDNSDYNLLSKLKNLLNNNYFSEVKTYNLTDETHLNEMNVFKYTNFVKIENAHNASRTYLRTNLINELLEVYRLNDSYKTKLEPIFEIQKIYTNEASELNLTAITTPMIQLDRISGSKIIMHVNGLKAVANLIANLFNTKFEYFVTSESDVFYHNELLAVQCNGKLIGYIGAIKSSQLKKYDLQNESIYCLTLNLSMLLSMYAPPTVHFSLVNNLMPIYKDISFTIHPLEKINNLLLMLNNLTFLQSYEFIDRYVLNDEQISYTLRFCFNNVKGLETKIIDKYLMEIEKQIIENHAKLRK
jgi:phenylalanyl-tRNA synthetase beta chain